MAFTTNQNIVAEYYIASLGRSPDMAGLNYWVGRLEATDATALTAAEIRDLFLDTTIPEVAVRFPTTDSATLVTAIYQNVFGRASDTEGQAYWEARLNGTTQGTQLTNSELLAEMLSAAKNPLNTVDAAHLTATLTAANAAYDAEVAAAPTGVVGNTLNLTVGVDTLTGTANDDTFNGNEAYVLDGNGTSGQTVLTALDKLDGGLGQDTLIVQSTANIIVPASIEVKNIEILNLESAENITADVTDTFTGLKTINVTKGNVVNITADTEAVNVSGIIDGLDSLGDPESGSTTITGGSTQTVNVSKGDVTLSAATGNVSVTNSAQTDDITINDGANVTVTATAKASSGAIKINDASDDVVVTQNLNSTGSAVVNGGAINVTGGKTVTVDVNSANDATKGTAAITTGLITVTGDDATTSVTVNQTEAVAAVAKEDAVAGVAEVASVKFVALTIGENVVLDGLTFTASKALTATEVAAAFANLTAGATHGGAKADNGIYSGQLNTFNTGAVSTDTVVFTAVEASIASSLSITGTSVGTEVVTTTTEGVTAAGAVAAVGAIANGQVVIADGSTTTDTIKTVVVDGYGASSSVTSDALTDLTLVNSTGTMAVSSTVASLNLNVDNIVGIVDLDGTAATTLKTLTINATGDSSDITLDAQAVETLTIAAGADLDVSGSDFAAVKTVTISGTNDVTLGDISATATALTSTTTGDISATVAGTATVTTASGDDSITVNTTTVTKAITLGAGNDTLDLTTFTTVNASTAAISGGEGTDTLVLGAANAAAFSQLAESIVFKSKVTGFEQLEIGIANPTNNINDDVIIDLANLGFNYVITNGTETNPDTDNTGSDIAEADTLELDKIANNGTVVLNANGLITVNVKDAAEVANTTDVLNVITKGDSTLGTLEVADVESINIATTETYTTSNNVTTANDDVQTLTLVAISAKTVTITGDADLVLEMAGNTAVTLIDASTLTGDLDVVSYNTTTSATINGGLGNDTITAATLDKVFGGAGNDYIVAGDLAELTGGIGADTFVGMIATTENSYSTIMDFNAAEGDSIKFASASDFNNTKVTLASTIGFEEYLDNAASIANGGNGTSVGSGTDGVSWFTYTDNAGATDTYLVYNQSADATFDVSTDMVIKVAGVVDFSTASFNEDSSSVAFINATSDLIA